MNRLVLAVLVVGLAFCGLWSCSPLAMATVPGAVQTLAAGGAGCLWTVGAGLGVALVVLALGGAVRLARPPVPRAALLYPVDPEPVRYLGEVRVLEGEYINVE